MTIATAIYIAIAIGVQLGMAAFANVFSWALFRSNMKFIQAFSLLSY